MTAPKKLTYKGATYIRADAAQMKHLLEKSKNYLQELFDDWVHEPRNYSDLRRLLGGEDTDLVEDRLRDKFLVDLGSLGEDLIDFKPIARELAGKK